MNRMLFYVSVWSILTLFSCGSDPANEDMPDPVGDEQPMDEAPSEPTLLCATLSDYVFNEKEGLIKVEFEQADFPTGWLLGADPNASGGRFMFWNGTQFFEAPGNGTVSFKIEVENPGTYQFIWHSAVTRGNDGTEHNDTWLRFPDATDFYGQVISGGPRIYPKGSGKSPNPKGSSADGWFKIYRSGSDLGFKWQSKTSDDDAHDIFVVFDEPGRYTMEVSARSTGHGIDAFVLFSENVGEANATASDAFSEITCDE